MKSKKIYVFFIVFLVVFLIESNSKPAVAQDFWIQTDMPAHLSIYSLGSDNNGNIYAGGYGQGLFKSSDNGNTWVSAGMSGYWITSISVNKAGDIFLVGIGNTYGTGIFKSSDYAQTWTRIFGFDDNYGGINCVYVAPDNTLWTGLNYSPAHNGIFRSTDNGETWDSVFSDLKNFNAIVATANGNVYAGSYGRIYYSLDNGATWSYSEEGLVPSKMTAMAANNDGQVFAASAGYGIYRAVNNGASWVTVASAGDDYSCLLIDSDNHIYAGTQGYWVRKSVDNGESWNLLNSGLTNRYILSLTIDRDGYLYAGSDTSGVFRSKNKVISGITQNYHTTFQFAIYPNPAQYTLNLKYVLPFSDEVTITFFNTLGETVKILIKEKQSAGKHQLNVSTSDFPPGIYFCKLKVGQSAQLIKVVVQ